MRWTRRFVAAFAGVLVVVNLMPIGGGAQTTAPQSAPTAGPPSPQMGAPQDAAAAPAFKPEELEQIAAPIALYPDPLLAQIFMASTYPVEIVQAARFAQANPSLKGDQLNEKLKDQTWDDSVKSLLSFPDVLTMMDQKLDWTQKLGDAVLAQQKDLMDAIQRLRAKAQAAGNLNTTPEQKVIVEQAPAASPAAAPAAGTPTTQTTVIKIEPSNPEVVYVPTYQPTTVYGGWPYPAYPPYAYYPPGYAFGTAALSFGVGMAVGAAVWGGCNWGGGEVDVDVNRQSTFNKNVNRETTQRTSARTGSGTGNRQNWQHDPSHRKGAQYRDTATQQRYNKQGAPNAASREAYRGRAEQGRQEMARSGAGQAGGAGGADRAAATRDAGQFSGGGARGGAESASIGSGGRAGGAAEARGAGAAGGDGQRAGGAGGGSYGGGGQRAGGASAGTYGGGQRAGGSAFEGAGQGRAAQSYSQRGGSSMNSARASGFQGGGGGARASGGGGRGGGGRR